MNKLITSMICVFTISTASCSTPDVLKSPSEVSGGSSYSTISQTSAEKLLLNLIERNLGIKFNAKWDEFSQLRPFLPFFKALMLNIITLLKGIDTEDLANYISRVIVKEACGVDDQASQDVIKRTLVRNADPSIREMVWQVIEEFLSKQLTWVNDDPAIIAKKEKIKKFVDMYWDIIQLSKEIQNKITSDLDESTKKEEISNLLIQYKDCFSPFCFPDEAVPKGMIKKYQFDSPLIGQHQLACWLVMAKHVQPTIQKFVHGDPKYKNILDAILSTSKQGIPSLLQQLFKGCIEDSYKKLIELIVNYIVSTEVWYTPNITQQNALKFLQNEIVDIHNAPQQLTINATQITNDYIAPYIALLAGIPYNRVEEVKRVLGTIKKSAEERTSFPIKRPVSDIGNIEDPRNPKRNESNRRMHLIEHEMNSDEQEDPLPSDSTKPIVFPPKYNTYDDLPKLEDPFDSFSYPDIESYVDPIFP